MEWDKITQKVSLGLNGTYLKYSKLNPVKLMKLLLTDALLLFAANKKILKTKIKK